jgi:hypothetical protein
MRLLPFAGVCMDCSGLALLPLPERFFDKRRPRLKNLALEAE